MSATANLIAPKNVSPLIRTARWSLLIAGILYGKMKYDRLQVIEAPIRKKEIELNTYRLAHEKAQKIEASEREQINVAKEFD
ncbi:hypothetical protein GJ496_004848 [Pomphorhynchus laevis]|nr:hypothetical protein GJ496_004848 [Pomphorhynchus laevis]